VHNREKIITEIAKKISAAKKLVFYTGAGIGVHSGIPDFRSPGGLWEKYDPFEVATLEAFKKNPEKVWDFLKELYHTFGEPKPNKAHDAITKIQQLKGKEKVFIATQNIDGLHQKSGSTNVFELHGNPNMIQCIRCLYEERFNFEKHVNVEPYPTCPKCGKPMKPKIVLFGEALNQGTFKKAMKIAKSSDIIIGVATSLEVFPAAEILLAPPPKTKKALFNLSPTYYDKLIHYKVKGDIIETLPSLAQKVEMELNARQ